MTTLIIKPGRVSSKVFLPPSKSYANRYLILAATKKKKSVIHQVGSSTDVINLISGLDKAGLKIQQISDTVEILNSFPECEKEDRIIDIGDGGTTARFLAALLLKGKRKYVLKMSHKLADRPWNELIKIAQAHGAYAELKNNELHLQGPLRLNQSLEVDCSETTQFATAFRLCYPETMIHPLNLESSTTYWLMNERVIQDLKEPEVSVPLDWSSAAFYLAFGAIHQKIKFPGLCLDTLQADSKFYFILKDLGHIIDEEDGLVVSPVQVSKNLELDMSDALDLVPAMAFYMANQSGQHMMRNVRNLIHKESNRLLEIQKVLDCFKIKNKVSENQIIIYGKSQRDHSFEVYSPPSDHRIVMMTALFMKLYQGGELSEIAAVSKSFPRFFDFLAE